jgi:N-acyl-D-aspartate/D-glutamate deacylase
VNRWLLHDVRVLDETEGFTEPADVTVADGVVTGVGRGLRDDRATVEQPGAVPGVFKAGVPVVPHPRLTGG